MVNTSNYRLQAQYDFARELLLDGKSTLEIQHALEVMGSLPQYKEYIMNELATIMAEKVNKRTGKWFNGKAFWTTASGAILALITSACGIDFLHAL